MIIETLENGNQYQTNKYSSNGANAYFAKSIVKISIYANGNILYSANRSSFEPVYLDSKNKIETNQFMHNVKKITLAKAIKQARKLDLNRKDNFVITESVGYDTGYGLYIHESEISVEKLGEYIQFESSGETNYNDLYKLTFKNGATYTHYVHKDYASIDDVIEEYGKYQVTNKWTTKDNPYAEAFDRSETKSKYPKLYENRDILIKGVRVEYQEECELASELFTQSGYTRQVKNNARIERENIAAVCKKAGVDLSHYDIERLQEVLNITIK